MSQSATTERVTPITRQEAEETLSRVRDAAARRTTGLSEQEKDPLADEVAREITDRLDARLHPRAKD